MSPSRPPKSELDKLRAELREKYRLPLAERLQKPAASPDSPGLSSESPDRVPLSDPDAGLPGKSQG